MKTFYAEYLTTKSGLKITECKDADGVQVLPDQETTRKDMLQATCKYLCQNGLTLTEILGFLNTFKVTPEELNTIKIVVTVPKIVDGELIAGETTKKSISIGRLMQGYSEWHKLYFANRDMEINYKQRFSNLKAELTKAEKEYTDQLKLQEKSISILNVQIAEITAKYNAQATLLKAKDEALIKGTSTLNKAESDKQYLYQEILNLKDEIEALKAEKPLTQDTELIKKLKDEIEALKAEKQTTQEPKDKRYVRSNEIDALITSLRQKGYSHGQIKKEVEATYGHDISIASIRGALKDANLLNMGKATDGGRPKIKFEIVPNMTVQECATHNKCSTTKVYSTISKTEGYFILKGIIRQGSF